MKRQLRWFKNRIGKKIYRKENTCSKKGCKDCLDVAQNGLLVLDEDHCRYLNMIQYDLDIEYFNKPI